jgi:hypothetical protein
MLHRSAFLSAGPEIDDRLVESRSHLIDGRKEFAAIVIRVLCRLPNLLGLIGQRLSGDMKN